jgi:hypothetical protein
MGWIGGFAAQRPTSGRGGLFCYDGQVAKPGITQLGTQFIRHVIPAILKPLHALWNEVIGFIFLCMGVIFGFSTARYAMRGDTMRTVVAGIAAFAMLYYGITSFLRARKISRS